jgi:hypothetical protein
LPVQIVEQTYDTQVTDDTSNEIEAKRRRLMNTIKMARQNSKKDSCLLM